MKTERKEIQKIEYVTTYIANDGTEFKNEEECKKYEATAECVINKMFKGLNLQETLLEDDYNLTMFYGDDSIYAVKIENLNQLEIVNKWIRMRSDDSCFGYPDDVIGTVQIIRETYDGTLWFLGTPEELKKSLSKVIDSFFDKLIDTAEETKGENE